MAEYRPGLSAEEVDAHLRGALQEYRAAEERSVLWFGEMVRRKLYRELGYSSVHQYAGERLGFSSGKTAQFLKLAEALEHLPGLRKSVASGDVPWTTAREVARVATPETEAAWLREARGSSRRALERKIRATRSRARAARRRNPAQGGLALVQGADGVRSNGARSSGVPSNGVRVDALASSDVRSNGVRVDALASSDVRSNGVRVDALASSDVRSNGVRVDALASSDVRSNGVRVDALASSDVRSNGAPVAIPGDPVSETDSPATEAHPAGTLAAHTQALETFPVDDADVDFPAVEVPVDLGYRLSPLEYARYEALIEALRKTGEKGSRNEILLAALEALLSERRGIESAPRAGRAGGSQPPAPARGSHSVAMAGDSHPAGPAGDSHPAGPAGDSQLPGTAGGSQPAAPVEPQSITSATSRYPGKAEGSGIARQTAPAHPPYQVFVRRCEDCGRGFVGTGRGERAVSRHQLEAVLCDARIRQPGEKNRAAIPPKVRREVLVRDAHRCRMPGCGRSRFLEVHHVRPRAAGGSNRAENLVTLCSGCHGVLHELGETRSRALLNSG